MTGATAIRDAATEIRTEETVVAGINGITTTSRPITTARVAAAVIEAMP